MSERYPAATAGNFGQRCNTMAVSSIEDVIEDKM
jgi:hypothetical protein